MQSAWCVLQRIVLKREALNEAYRGQSDVRMTDLRKLGDAIAEKTGKAAKFNPEGGVIEAGGYPFDPSIWTGWRPDPGIALTTASTDSSRHVYHKDVPQGGTVMKRNYGGRVVYQPAPARPHANDRLGSTMDRYDVIMVGTVSQRTNRNGRVVDVGSLQRLAYAPAIGTAEERRARLEALLAGESPGPLSRRPQPELPDTREPSRAQPAVDVPRQGQLHKAPKRED